MNLHVQARARAVVRVGDAAGRTDRADERAAAEGIGRESRLHLGAVGCAIGAQDGADTEPRCIARHRERPVALLRHRRVGVAISERVVHRDGDQFERRRLCARHILIDLKFSTVGPTLRIQVPDPVAAHEDLLDAVALVRCQQEYDVLELIGTPAGQQRSDRSTDRRGRAVDRDPWRIGRHQRGRAVLEVCSLFSRCPLLGLFGFLLCLHCTVDAVRGDGDIQGSNGQRGSGRSRDPADDGQRDGFSHRGRTGAQQQRDREKAKDQTRHAATPALSG